jgi:hypothetical protein
MAIAVLVDFWVAPFPTTTTDCPDIYRELRDRAEPGALVELPLGLGDGFGALTPFDHRALVCQAVHRRPLVGGVIARLPKEVLSTYEHDPLIATWLRFSGAGPTVIPAGAPADGAAALRSMERDDIRFVLLDRHAASLELQNYVEQVLPVQLVSESNGNALFVRTADGRSAISTPPSAILQSAAQARVR